MSDQATITAIEAMLGHHFAKPERVIRALTHASAGQGKDGGDGDYERLEFLGDRVINLAVADLLYAAFPKEKEGDLARRHTAFVRGEALAVAARHLGIEKYLRLSEAEKAAGGASNPNILADSMEALLGAFFLDAGYDKVRDFIGRMSGAALLEMQKPPIDPKTALQEWSQSCGRGLPRYDMVGRSGPDHAPEFIMQVSVEGFAPVSAVGASKRLAEKAAAEELLARVLTAGKKT